MITDPLDAIFEILLVCNSMEPACLERNKFSEALCFCSWSLSFEFQGWGRGLMMTLGLPLIYTSASQKYLKILETTTSTTRHWLMPSKRGLSGLIEVRISILSTLNNLRYYY